MKISLWFNDIGATGATFDPTGNGLISLIEAPAKGDQLSILVFNGEENIDTTWIVTERTWSTNSDGNFDLELDLNPCSPSDTATLAEHRHIHFGSRNSVGRC